MVSFISAGIAVCVLSLGVLFMIGSLLNMINDVDKEIKR